MTEAMYNVLVIEDEADLRGVLCTMLRANGCRTVEAESGQRGLIEARSHRPDLLLVDLGLPDCDGADLIREVRRESAVPVLVLSARTLEAQKIAALDAGADDYVTKPFSAAELMARVRAALRRATRGGTQAPRLRLGAITIDLEARRASGPEGDVHLTPIEFRIVGALGLRAGLVVPQRQLIGQAWGAERIGDAQNLRFHVSRLRQKLEPDPARPRYLLTEPGVGYRLLPDT